MKIRPFGFFIPYSLTKDRLCGLVIIVHGYRSRGPLPDFLRISGSGTGSTQPREDNRGAT
jgi:hypothetical protein